MSLLETIKSDLTDARVQRDRVRSLLLSTLVGEVTTEQKKGSGGTWSDSDTIRLVRKFLKNIRDFLDRNPPTEQIEILLKERAILDKYNPVQMTQTELENFIDKCFGSGITDMGGIMKELKSKKDGLFDGRMASSIIKRRTEKTS